jgi:ribosomal protein S18 acetylase RimI-like enzyme
VLDLRSAVASEVPALVQILNEAQDYKAGQGDEDWGDTPFTTEEVGEMVATGNTYVGTVDGQPAAAVMLTWEDAPIWDEKGVDEQAAYVHRLAVGDRFRGQHLGEQILEWAGDEARKAGRKYLRLDCPAGNEKLQSYYRSLGFQLIDKQIRESYEAARLQKPH